MSSVPEKIRGGGELFKFRWTAFSRVQQFPFKFYWKHARVFRYFFYSSFIIFPLMVKGTLAVNSPGNVQKWDEIRKAKHRILASRSLLSSTCALFCGFCIRRNCHHRLL